ncbi:MAG TPA: DNA polymerase domain-containing protein, partial [Chthoniobacterales bacterium]
MTNRPDLANDPVLFGSGKRTRIVAVEFLEPDRIQLYQRGEDGSTQTAEEPFQPYLWAREGGSALGGRLPLNHRQTFATWAEFQTARKADPSSFSSNDPVQQYLVATGETHFKEMAFEDLRRLQLDIETACEEGFAFSNAARDPILAIALSDSTGWEECLIAEDAAGEKAALERLTELIRERDPDVLEGHNLFKFDLPYLAARAKKLKVKLAWGRDGSPLGLRSSRLQIAEKAIQYSKPSIHGRHVVDTWVLAQLYDVSSRELESFGLKAVARHFGIAESERVYLPGTEIQNAFRGDRENFIRYAIHDVRETRALAALLSRSYFIQAQIFPFSYQDVIIRGNATRIDSLFLREYLRQRHSIPEFPNAEGFEGGYTDIFKTGVLSGVWHCDVASLYPSVMLQFDLLPANDELKIFRQLLANLRAFRLAAKQRLRGAANETEANYFNALQTAFKILINSFYGYLGFAQGHFADFQTAAAVTAKGREILQHLVGWRGRRGAAVIEIDTDGIYFQPPAGATPDGLQRELQAELPAGIEVELDQQYAAMFSYKTKNYALLETGGRMVIKGAALKSRGLEKFLRDYLERLLRFLLEGRSAEAAGLRDSFAQKIRAREWPIEMLA